MIYNFEGCCGSFLGNGPDHNEDNFYFNRKHLPSKNNGMKHPLKYASTTDDVALFSVFDGLGGESGGEDAACIAAETFTEKAGALEHLAISGKEFLYTVCERANAAVGEMRVARHLKRTGTTLAAMYLLGDEVVVANVGDSRIFRVRDRRLTQISEDHTDEKIMSAIGIKKKPVLLQYIGVPDTEMLLEPYLLRGKLQEGDVYLLCTDGVTDVLEPDSIYGILSRGSAEESLRELLLRVDEMGGTDNATAIVVKII